MGPMLLMLSTLPTGQDGTRPKVGLRPEDPAEMRGHANRSRAIRSLVERPVTGGRGDAGAGRRGARVEPLLPGVVGDAGQRALAHPLPAELRRGGLAEGDGAGAAKPGDQRRVHLGHDALMGVRAAVGRNAGGERQVLDGERNPVERPKRVAANHGVFGRARRRARGVDGQMRERVETGLQSFDARQHGLHHLARRDLTCADQDRELGRGRKAKLGRVHGSMGLQMHVSQCPSQSRGQGRAVFTPLPATGTRG